MATLHAFVAIALTQRGDPYEFGAEAEFSDPDPPEFDCSELVQWAAARCQVRFVDGAQNQRNACQQANALMDVNEGIRTRGALLFRIDEAPGNDHVAISLGNGKTIEARGEAYGVNRFSAAGRPWTHAGIVPGLSAGGTVTVKHGDEMLALDDEGERVRWLQRRLQLHGFEPGPADGVFGSRTEEAVRAFQTAKGLEVDGVVGRETKRALREQP
ncbi:MAG TPA: peptidoglycan-binding protein [Actinomycetota bacterium]|nr:peptidoglycan-binding protein [Actinomycetota bacterium]